MFTQRRGSYIGYSLVSVDRQTNYYETHLRTYFDDRKVFDEARDVVNEGRFYSSQAARQFWRKIAKPVDDRLLREQLSGPCLDALKAEMKASDADRDAHEKFVPAPMKRTFVQAIVGDEAKSFVETVVPFDELVGDGKAATTNIWLPVERVSSHLSGSCLPVAVAGWRRTASRG